MSLSDGGNRERPEKDLMPEKDPMPTKSTPSPKRSNKKGKKKRKPRRRQRPRPNISDITLDGGESVASSISRSSSLSEFLEGESIYTSSFERPKSDGMCVNPLAIPTFVSEKVPTCVNEDAILKKVSDDVVKVTVKGDSNKNSIDINDEFSPSLFPKSTSILDEASEAKEAQHEETKTSEKPSIGLDRASKPSMFTLSIFALCLSGSQPSTSVSELLTSASGYFSSSPLDPDGDCSVRSTICIKKQIMDSGENVPKEICNKVPVATSDTPIKQKVLGDQSLLDIDAALEPPNKEVSENPAKNQEEEEEENITEGLGLILPPPVSLKRSSRNPNNIRPNILETVDESEIEIDASDHVVNVIDHSNSRDVYIKYRIESDSQCLENKSTPMIKLGHSLTKKLLSKNLLGDKLFSSGKKKGKGNTKKKNGIAKLRKSVLDSPGSSTAGTAETAHSIMSFAAFSFGEDHPANPLKLPFLRRRRQESTA